MSDFTKRLTEYIDTVPHDIIRVSTAVGDGEIETVERIPAMRCQDIYSVAKTFTMAAIGIAYDRGLVRPEDRIIDIFADELPDGMDERWQYTTIDCALTHRMGLPGGFLDIDVYHSHEFGEDYLDYMFRYPLINTPGTERIYTDGAFYLLSRVAEKVTGEPIDNLLWREMFLKFDSREMAWSHCPLGHPMGATGLYIMCEDMVKLGQVFLCGGTYKGKRILSEEWVKLAMERGYGLDCSEGVYSKGGMFGQVMMFSPANGRVAAVQSFEGSAGEVAGWINKNG